jgi:hypothetical protein
MSHDKWSTTTDGMSASRYGGEGNRIAPCDISTG